MKSIKTVIPLIIIGTLLSCLIIYFLLPQEIRWVVSSVLDVPACTARIADKLEIQPEIGVVKEYIIQSLQLGMTSEEVEKTLSQIAPISTVNSFIDNEQGIHQEIIIRLCDNPLGNVLLFVYYSKEGYLINVTDVYAD